MPPFWVIELGFLVRTLGPDSLELEYRVEVKTEAEVGDQVERVGHALLCFG